MNKMLKHIIGVFAGLVCFVIYIMTLYPSTAFMDSGELAAACYTMGIPHPTGYPLFLIIGYLFSHLPIGSSVIYRLNLLSAIEAAAAVVVTYYASFILIKHVFEKLAAIKSVKKQVNKSKGADKKESGENPKKSAADFSLLFYVLSAAAAMCAGFSRTFWSDATQVEVYALHSLFLSIIVLYCIKILVSLNEPNKKNWVVLFLVTGLSFANHLTTVFIAPGILYILYLQYSTNKEFTKKILPLVLLVVPGLLLYIVLMIVASSAPFLNWSDIQSFGNLMDHVRGTDFSQLMFSAQSKFSDSAAAFFKELPGELAYIPLLFSLAGLILLWKTFKQFVIFLALSSVFTLLYAFNYNIIDINTYYLLVFYFLALAVPAGIVYLVSFGSPQLIFTAKNEPNSSLTKAVVVGLILVIFSAGYNYKVSDNSSNYANVDFPVNAINSLPQNSILITFDWAYLYSASLYFQLVENTRPDVKIFIIKFLSAPWYLKTISKYHPEIYECIKPEAEEYIKVYDKDEKVKVPKLTALVKAFIDNCSAKFPLYATLDVTISKDMKQFLTGFITKPVGLVYRIEPKNMPYDPANGVNTLGYNFRKFEPDTPHKNKAFRVISGMYFETAYYHYINKNFELSLKFLDKSLEFDPTFKEALNLKSKIITETK